MKTAAFTLYTSSSPQQFRGTLSSNQGNLYSEKFIFSPKSVLENTFKWASEYMRVISHGKKKKAFPLHYMCYVFYAIKKGAAVKMQLDRILNVWVVRNEKPIIIRIQRYCFLKRSMALSIWRKGSSFFSTVSWHQITPLVYSQAHMTIDTSGRSASA